MLKLSEFMRTKLFPLLVFISVLGTQNSVTAQSIDDLEKLQENVDQNKFTSENIVIALGIFIGSVILSRITGYVVRKALSRIKDEHSRPILSFVERLSKYAVVGIGAITALSTVGINVAWITIVLSLLTVLAFLTLRPLVENLSAGILLRTRPSFDIGSEVELDGYRGKVVDINARSTVLKTRDWRRIHIPNQEVLKHQIVVYDGFPHRRSDMLLEINHESDIETVEKILIKAISKINGVPKTPSPSVRLRGFGQNIYQINVRWWHGSSLSAQSQTQDKVLRAIQRALAKNGVAMSSSKCIVKTSSPDN